MDKKITDLAALTSPSTNDLVEIVDVSDTSMAATGTNKKISVSDLNTVDSVNGQTGEVVIDAANVGAVASVQGGTNITVDATDPQNPIVGVTSTDHNDTTNIDGGEVGYYGHLTQEQHDNIQLQPIEYTLVVTAGQPGESGANPYIFGTNGEQYLRTNSGTAYVVLPTGINLNAIFIAPKGDPCYVDSGSIASNSNRYDLSSIGLTIGWFIEADGILQLDKISTDNFLIHFAADYTAHQNFRFLGSSDFQLGYEEIYTLNGEQYTNVTNTSGVNTGDQDLSGYQLTSEKNQANGYAGLDANAKLFAAQLTYHNHQAGLDDVPVITEGTGGDAGKFSVATADVWFFTDPTMDDMEIHTIADSGYLTPADDTTTYVCADRDTDTWAQLTAVTDIDYLRYIPYFIVFKRASSNNLHHQVIKLTAHGEVEQHHQRVLSTNKYDRESGALESISVDSSLNITASGGGVWATNNRYIISPITTSTRQFFNYQTTLGNWVVSSHTAPVINNTQWNDVGVGLDTLTDTYWTINYLFRGIEDQDHCYTVLGTQEYATSVLAQADNSVPTTPDLINSHTMFIGRIIVQKNTTSDYIIESAFKTVFAASSAVTVHNSLTGRSTDSAHPASAINTLVLGSPTLVTNQENIDTYSWSAGVVSGGDLTDNGNGTVDIATGESMLRISASDTADLKSMVFPAITNLSLTDLSTNFVFVNYNAGTPVIQVSTSSSDFNCMDKCHLYTISREGNSLHILDGRKMNVDGNRKLRRRLYDTTPIARADSGAVLGFSSRNLTVTSGNWWYSLNQVSNNAINTGTGDTFEYYRRNGSGGWTEVEGNTQVNNTQYDNGSGTLASLTGSNYSVQFVYLILGTTVELAVLHSQGQFTGLATAQAAGAPSAVPPSIAGAGVLIGRIIIQRNASAITQADSAFTNTFSAAGGIVWGNIGGTLANQTDLQSALDGKVTANGVITGNTKTKITYDTKGLVTAGSDATTADITDSLDKRYVTDAELAVIAMTSGTNTGDQTLPIDSTITVTDNTGNDVSTSAHGWCPKVTDTSKFLKGDGTWSTVTASTPDTLFSKLKILANTVITTGYSAYISPYIEIDDGIYLEIEGEAYYEIG